MALGDFYEALFGEAVESADHAVFDGVEVGVADGDGVAFTHDLGVVVDAEEGVKAVGSDDFSVEFVFDFSAFHGDFEDIHHAGVSEPVVEFGDDEVVGFADVDLSDAYEACWGDASAVSVSAWDAVGVHFDVWVA